MTERRSASVNPCLAASTIRPVWPIGSGVLGSIGDTRVRTLDTVFRTEVREGLDGDDEFLTDDVTRHYSCSDGSDSTVGGPAGAEGVE